nr:hypothetical protein [Pandoravirus massiliensis]
MACTASRKRPRQTNKKTILSASDGMVNGRAHGWPLCFFSCPGRGRIRIVKGENGNQRTGRCCKGNAESHSQSIFFGSPWHEKIACALERFRSRAQNWTLSLSLSPIGILFGCAREKNDPPPGYGGSFFSVGKRSCSVPCRARLLLFVMGRDVIAARPWPLVTARIGVATRMPEK